MTNDEFRAELDQHAQPIAKRLRSIANNVMRSPEEIAARIAEFEIERDRLDALALAGDEEAKEKAILIRARIIVAANQPRVSHRSIGIVEHQNSARNG